MPKKVLIKSLGPIKYFEGDIKDVMIFIGPQASGKSTIARVVYFFYSLRSLILNEIFRAEHTISIEVCIKIIKKKYYEFIGEPKRLENSEIKFLYSKSSSVFIKIIESKIEVYFSPGLEQIINNHQIKRIEDPFESRELVQFDEAFSNALKVDLDTTFIPANRSSTINSNVGAYNRSLQRPQFLMSEIFIEYFFHIEKIKNQFKGKSFDDLILSRNDIYNDVNESLFSLIKAKVYNILKGEYRYNGNYEVLKFGQGQSEFVFFENASSGQQEVIRILQEIFLLLLNNEKKFLVIEEPEAHLFPEAQKELVELIGIVLNETDSKIFITTHSPYILTAFNNLILVKAIQNQGKKIPQELNLDHTGIDINRIGAYYLEERKAKSIIDRDLIQLKAEAIDNASEKINEAFYKLFELVEVKE